MQRKNKPIIKFMDDNLFNSFLFCEGENFLIYDVKMSRQTSYISQSSLIDQYLDKEENGINKLIQELNIKPSGFYNYDEEFIKISKEIYVRMTIIDAHTRLIINDQIIKRVDFTKETIKKYFKESFKEFFKGLKLNTIIIDGYSAYPEIIEEIGAKYHSCTFHIMQRLMLPLQKHINKRNRSMKSLEEQIEKKYRKNRRIKKQNAT